MAKINSKKPTGFSSPLYIYHAKLNPQITCRITLSGGKMAVSTMGEEDFENGLGRQ